MHPGAALLRGGVAPASYIPHLAREWRALIVEHHLEPTRLTSSLTDHFLKGSAGKLLPRVLEDL
jgi:hypothetical protein